MNIYKSIYFNLGGVFGICITYSLKESFSIFPVLVITILSFIIIFDNIKKKG